MSENILKERRNALEEEFFARKNKEALDILSKQLKESTRLSPISKKEMTPKVVLGIQVYECEDSKGVWIEKNELLKLIQENQDISWDQCFFKSLANEAKNNEARGLLKVAIDNEGKRLSPVNSKPMTKIQAGEVILDFCEESQGVWFDSHELVRFMKSSNFENLNSWVNTFYKAIGYK